MKFVEFRKIPRLSRDIIISEKIDGSNGQICIFSLETMKKEFSTLEELNSWIEQFCLYIHPDNPHVEEKDKLYIFAASRNRWLNVGKQNDNHAFAYWVKENAPSLVMLGEGRHYGEWMGKGIQRGYGLEEKRFYLFNVSKWVKKHDGKGNTFCLEEKQQYCPDCCEVVPVLYEGEFCTQTINGVLGILKTVGSKAVPGYNLPEGICIYHEAAGQYFKKTIDGDDKPKGVTNG